jgi:hypothetical protein
MTLWRTIVFLGVLAAVMLTVVVLRAETTRLNYRLSELDREAEGIRQQLREKELELARRRHPMLIRSRALEMRLTSESAAGEERSRPARPARPARP